MAGSEKSGYSNSKAFLIENAYYVITPSDTVPEERIQTFQELILSLRAIPIRLNYRQHDQITGMISHLPHIIASGLVNFVKEQDDSNQLMKMLAAGGFKDITRIASSSPTMWEHICLLNQEYLSEILSEYIASLEKIKALVDTSDADRLHSFFSEAREYRNSMPELSAGPIKKSFSIYCDLIDEAGYSEYWRIRLGHFIGQEDHEYGDVSPINKNVAEPGMIFSIEPGIYLEGKYGVRVEDLVLVTEDGHELLNAVDKKYRIVG